MPLRRSCHSGHLGRAPVSCQRQPLQQGFRKGLWCPLLPPQVSCFSWQVSPGASNRRLPASATPSAAPGPLIPPALGNGARVRERWDFPFFGPSRPLNSTHTHTHAPRKGPASGRRGFSEEVHICPAGFVPTEADSGKAQRGIRQLNPPVSGLGGQWGLTGLGYLTSEKGGDVLGMR